ncbi:MAG TPA: DoxX family protein [Propionibacteriaceae bacterium]|nr:DoxX family protein [Propionibacteriaceae bacterium]
MDGIGKGLQSTALLIARIGLGALLILQGISHWQPSGEGVQRLTLAYAAAGAPYASVGAWTTTIFELVGGIFLVVGALTRFVGAGVVVLSALSISYLSWYKYRAVLAADGSDTGGIEYDVALALLGLLFLAFGGGAVAVDRLFKRKKPVAEPEEDSTYPSTSSSSSTAVRTSV